METTTATPANTRTRILARALEMFNDRGIEGVGLREIASDLDLHVGNLTYYFPTKDDLVNELALELNRLNDKAFGARPRSTLTALLEALRVVFRNQRRYRCLMLSIVHVNTRNRAVARRHKRTQRTRNDLLAADIAALAAAGHLQTTDPTERTQLAETMSLLARFWMSEATISYRRREAEAQIAHYLSLVARLLLPYASPAGCAELASYLDGAPRLTPVSHNVRQVAVRSRSAGRGADDPHRPTDAEHAHRRRAAVAD